MVLNLHLFALSAGAVEYTDCTSEQFRHNFSLHKHTHKNIYIYILVTQEKLDSTHHNP